MPLATFDFIEEQFVRCSEDFLKQQHRVASLPKAHIGPILGVADVWSGTSPSSPRLVQLAKGDFVWLCGLGLTS